MPFKILTRWRSELLVFWRGPTWVARLRGQFARDTLPQQRAFQHSTTPPPKDISQLRGEHAFRSIPGWHGATYVRRVQIWQVNYSNDTVTSQRGFSAFIPQVHSLRVIVYRQYVKALGSNGFFTVPRCPSCPRKYILWFIKLGTCRDHEIHEFNDALPIFLPRRAMPCTTTKFVSSRSPGFVIARSVGRVEHRCCSYHHFFAVFTTV